MSVPVADVPALARPACRWTKRAPRAGGRAARLLALALTALVVPLALPTAAQAAIPVEHSTRVRLPAHDPCPRNLGRIACVDLTDQEMWVKTGDRVVFGPVHIRSGRAGYVTRTGMKRIYRRVLHEFSNLYFTPMPYSQYFDRGIAFHAISGSVYEPPGSRGCVNLTMADAKVLWSTTRIGDPVDVWGRKPGT